MLSHNVPRESSGLLSPVCSFRGRAPQDGEALYFAEPQLPRPIPLRWLPCVLLCVPGARPATREKKGQPGRNTCKSCRLGFSLRFGSHLPAGFPAILSRWGMVNVLVAVWGVSTTQSAGTRVRVKSLY